MSTPALISSDIVDGLDGHAGLDALIDGRIYPMVLPQSVTLPAVTYQMISRVFEQTLTRAVKGRLSRYQFTAWAATATDRDAVAHQLELALVALPGSAVTIYSLDLDGSREFFDPELPLHRRDIDALILHS